MAEHGNYKAMHEAAVAGDLELVEFYVRSGVDVDYIHPEFMTTALVSTILNGHEKVANFLLDSGADPRLVSPLDELDPRQAAEQVGLKTLSDRLS